MATSTAALISQARKVLLEEVEDDNSFWTDDELKDIAVLGYKDLWGAIIDQFAAHYQTVDETNVTLAANTATLTGVPADVFRVELIEPRDTTQNGTTRDVAFVPRAYNSADFIAARQMDNVDPSQPQIVYYALSGVGSPVAAPTIRIAPKLTSAMNIRLVYNQTIPVASINPIPGEADQAVKAWIIAWALAKEREDRSPDTNWLAVYATEKQHVLMRITPRQTQEPEYVEEFFRLDC